MLYHSQIMGNEQIGQPFFLLKADQKIYDLSLYRYVQCGDRLIAYDKFRLHGKGSGNSDPLALTAGKLMDISCRMLGIKTYRFQKLLLCGAKGLLTLSPGSIMGEAVFGGLTGTALMAGNLLIDYMKDTGMDIYILLIWALLSLFVIQYSFYFFIKGLERMLQQHERAKRRKLRKRKKQEE